MDIPEHLHELVDQLGQALVQALATDPASRALARKIQGEGFEVMLLLEATVALHKREEGDTEDRIPPEAQRAQAEPQPPWSEEDRAFLRTFKISLD